MNDPTTSPHLPNSEDSPTYADQDSRGRQLERPYSPCTPPSQRSIRAYVIGDSTRGLSQDVRRPERARRASIHVDSQQLQRSSWQYSTLLTVTPRDSLRRQNSDRPSFASSGLSAQEVTVPPFALSRAQLQSPATYCLIVTDQEPVGPNIDGSQAERNRVTYDLELLAGSSKIATAEQLIALESSHPLPSISKKSFMELRYLIFSTYRRLMVLVVVANVAAIALMISRVVQDSHAFTYGDAATAVGANLATAVLMRFELFINLLFWLACSLPSSTPVQIRRHAAKLAYSQGGIHSGCGNGALLWYIFYTVLLVKQFKGTAGESEVIAATAAAALLMFICIIAMAHPWMRQNFHNHWELTHRYGGWTAIALVWAQTIIVTIAAVRSSGGSFGITLIRAPAFWLLVFITGLLIHPWLYLRRRRFTAEQMSSHATRLWFDKEKLTSCKGMGLSHSPLLENHKFATIPKAGGEKGYSMVISNAGDWTKKIIADPPQYVWTRGAPTTGVMRVAAMFKPVVVVATGSGIGPCLSFLQVFPDHPMRVIWSARFPEATYGKSMMDSVLRADENAIIIDTKKTGHPHLSALTYAIYQELNAEAIIIISNPKVTREVVYDMEVRGVPAFGAIFDS